MNEAPFPEGAFVWTNFPFGPPEHRPDQPGPVPHIAYVLGHRMGRQGVQMLLAYTSSGRWRGAGPALPVGVIEFDAAAAQRVGQRAFYLDLRCLARMLLTEAWFPRLREAERGVVAVADRGVRERVLREAEGLAARRAGVIEIRGMVP